MQYVFEEQFGLEYKIIVDENEFIYCNVTEKIIYSKNKTGDGLYFYSCDLLQESDIKEFNLSTAKIENDNVLFKHNKEDALGFDVFAAIFYLLSRYEEYLKKPRDKFGNYDFKNSILHQLNIMHVPLVEQWMNMLKTVLKNNFPSLQFKSAKAKFALSFDVDVAYAYQNRSLGRTFGGLSKKIIKLNFSDLADHVFTMLHLKKDMFDTYEYILSKIKNNKAIFFFNMGCYAKFDKNPSYRNKKFQLLIKQLHAKNLIGLHPSYASNSDHKLIAKEKNWLEEIVDEKINSSRQHYLKLKLPTTYQQLIKNGIQNDYSIGYHDTFGFRAGTCKPFLFFDLKKNETSNLQLFPFAIMEGTLDDVMKLNFEASKKIISDLISEVCKYEGIFVPLWHNSTVNTRMRRAIFEYMLDEIENKKLMNLFN